MDGFSGFGSGFGFLSSGGLDFGGVFEVTGAPDFDGGSQFTLMDHSPATGDYVINLDAPTGPLPGVIGGVTTPSETSLLDGRLTTTFQLTNEPLDERVDVANWPERVPDHRLFLPKGHQIDSDDPNVQLEQFLNPFNDPWGGVRNFPSRATVSSSGQSQTFTKEFQPHNLKPYTGPTAPVLRNPYHALPEDVPFTPMNNGASDSSTVNGAHSHSPTFKNQPSRSDSGQTIDRQPVWSSPAPQQNRPK